MSYHNPRTTPSHWKALRIPDRKINRNPSRYTVTMVPGKPLTMSTPLSLILKRYTNDPLVTLKKVRAYLPRVKINGKPPKDLRAPVAMTDVVEIQGTRYMFMLIKLGKTVTYRLEQDFTPQHCVRRIISSKEGVSLLESMTGFRLHHRGQGPLVPGSVMVGTKIHSPMDGSIKALIKLTGKHKYQSYQVVSAHLTQDKVRLGLVRETQRQELVVSWEDFQRRRYLTLV